VILVVKTGRGFFSWREGVAVRVGTAALGYRRECGFVPAGCDPTPAAGNHRFPGRECRFISSPPTVLCRWTGWNTTRVVPRPTPQLTSAGATALRVIQSGRRIGCFLSLCPGT